MKTRIDEDQTVTVYVWCDGSTPCMVSDGEKPGDVHAHWRGGRSVKVGELLDGAREEMREACTNEVEDTVILSVANSAIVAACRATPLKATPLANRIETLEAELASLKEEYECMRQGGIELRAQMPVETKEAQDLRKAFADWAGIGIELGHLPGIVMSTIRALVTERDEARTRAADRDGLLAELARKSKDLRAWEIDARTAQSALAAVTKERDTFLASDVESLAMYRRARDRAEEAQEESRTRHELLVDIARHLDRLGEDLSSIPGFVAKLVEEKAKQDKTVQYALQQMGAESDDLVATVEEVMDERSDERDRADAAEIKNKQMREALEQCVYAIGVVADKLPPANTRLVLDAQAAARLALREKP